ncbi:MAG: hypothetical protein ACKVQS_12760 [Fimbriimonadaceae bacterium]
MKRISFKQLCPRIGAVLLISLTIAACHSGSDTPWETFVQPVEAYKPRANSGNAWDEYLLAANLATHATEKYADRADLRQVEESDYLARINDSLIRAIQASSLPCHEEFTPHDPFLPRPEAVGFTAIGRGLGLRIKLAAKSNSAGNAATPIIAAHRMANQLSQGDAEDALLGYWIASNARIQAAGMIERIDAGSLRTIGNSILASLEDAPKASQTIEHEYKNMLFGVQFVQDTYRDKNYKLLHTAFYDQANPAIEYLEGMRSSDRPKYFRNFAAEAKIYCNYATSVADQPVLERKKLDLELSGERPWRRFSLHLFSPVISFIEARDRHITRSRLFALTCLALAQGKSTGKAPSEFTGLPANATIDPYSGKPFPYLRAEREFKIYSVGEDGRDDGGETKGRGLAPDITIEPAEK